MLDPNLGQCFLWVFYFGDPGSNYISYLDTACPTLVNIPKEPCYLTTNLHKQNGENFESQRSGNISNVIHF